MVAMVEFRATQHISHSTHLTSNLTVQTMVHRSIAIILTNTTMEAITLLSIKVSKTATITSILSTIPMVYSMANSTSSTSEEAILKTSEVPPKIYHTADPLLHRGLHLTKSIGADNQKLT